MEDDDYDDLMEVETDDEVIPSEFTGKLNEKFVKSWERPEVAKFEPQKDSIIFQQIEIDYTMGDVVPGYSATSVGPVPILRLFGVNEKGNSVLAYVHGYMPYFYIVAPNNFKESDCEGVRLKLNNHMKIHRSSFQYADFVLEVCIIRDHRSIMGYKPNPYPFLKITMAAPMLVPTARKIFERGEIMPATTTFESNIQFALRFMIDKDIVGASWIECPAAKYQLVEESKKQSLSQIELIIRSDDIVSLGVDGEWAKIAPIRLLSFDIECTSRKGVFPEPEMDSVIQIGNYVNVQGMDAPLVKTIFTFRGCSPIVGSQVISFNDEKEMLENWSRFVRYIDPDIITGYNIANFDFYYLTQRAKTLKANQFLFLSRITREKSRIKEAEFSSKAYGRRVTKTLAMSGRVQLDMLLVMQRDYKLRSYTLNAVSAHFLGQQKEDVHYSNISELFNGTDNDRRRLAVYCLKDSYLPLLLMDKLMVVVNYLEMARVTGVPVNYLLAHGQQVKVQSQLYRKARQVKLIIPTVTVKVDGGDEVAYEGATVIPPKSGFYDKPISTLDFASLYPSIMMAHNLCYSTLLTAEDAKMLPPSSYVRTPSGDYFLKREVQQGVLPCILEELIAARKTARKALEQEKDPFRAAVHNGRQLALKISANSVYGFTGALRGKLPCIAISASVTAFGRVMIDQTKKLVEEKYNIANGYKNDAVVIYGDTDSVMVKFGVETVKEAMELGREASQFVSATFVKPINLEFEKVYFPYLLMKKKRYAGLLWTKEDKHDKMDAKGIVTVRRDNCSLVREVIDTCLHKILIERDPASAELFVKKVVADLLQNKIDLSLLVITKALSKNEYQVKQAHVELAERMKKRDAGSAPSLGDRIPYVIVQRGGKSVPAYEKAEDPLFVLENNIDLDLQYYLEHQLKKPLIAIFGPIMKNPQSLISGEHTMTVASSTPKSSSFFKTGFVKRQVRCMNCNAVIQNDDKAILCTYCKQLGIEVKMYQQAMKNVTDLEVKFSRIWTQCQSCQGSFHQPVLCTSRDCPIFYMRKKVQKDLNHAQENLERFQADDW